jgi:hypothetical protein
MEMQERNGKVRQGNKGRRRKERKKEKERKGD